MRWTMVIASEMTWSGSRLRSRQLLARIEQALGVQRVLDGPVDPHGGRVPLAREPPALEHPDAVLAGDRPARVQSEGEELLHRRLGPGQLLAVAGVEQERGVQVAVARMPPRARLQAMAFAERHDSGDRLGEAVERHGDVLGELAAAARGDRDRHAVAPAG